MWMSSDLRPSRAGLVTAVGLVCITGVTDVASAQAIETVGTRALGMAGAFVAVANDSSATWWNPGALADGPFVDFAVGRAALEVNERVPAWRTDVSQFSLSTPPIGFSYYRLRMTEIPGGDPTAAPDPDREDEQSGIPLRYLSASQFGATVLYSFLPGIHAGTTLKYVRGSLRTGIEDAGVPISELLERGDDLADQETQHHFDFDIGVLAVGGPLRVGAVFRNLAEIEFDAPAGGPPMRLPRQMRAGVAFDGTSSGVPLIVAFDADLSRYAIPSGDRRVLAVGTEYWVVKKRVAFRGGARFNTVGAEERVATGGASVAVKSGFFVEGHIVHGGDADERGWGVATRLSF